MVSELINNTFLNMSYDSEVVEAGGELIRKWYYQANVSEYYSGNAIAGVNVTAFGSNDYLFNLTTDNTGLTGIENIIDYVNFGGTRTYYSDYNIFGINSTYFNRNVSWNVTAQENTLHSFYLVKSQSNITLNTGWNLISLSFDSTDSGTDRNISLVPGWNLIGIDANVTINNSITFTNDTTQTWTNALASNKLQAYFSYYDSSPTNASNRKYKYATSLRGFDDTSLRKNKGYWVYANSTGNLTLPGVGGSLTNATYSWDKLRFWNGSDELNITDAGDEGWLTTTLQYWNTDEEDFGLIKSSPPPTGKTTISSWEGIFVNSNIDNLTIIRQN